MRHAAALALLLAAAPLQAQTHAGRPLRFAVRVPIGARTRLSAPVCDGSEMQHVQQRRTLGKVLFIGGLGAIVASPMLVNGTDASGAVDVMMLGAVASSVGVYMHYYSKPSEEFWQTTLPTLKVGHTSSVDARECFRNPSAYSMGGAEEVWTYNMASPGLFGLGGSSRTVSLVFRNGVLADIRRSSSSF